jgi:hypothetical protein
MHLQPETTCCVTEVQASTSSISLVMVVLGAGLHLACACSGLWRKEVTDALCSSDMKLPSASFVVLLQQLQKDLKPKESEKGSQSRLSAELAHC